MNNLYSEIINYLDNNEIEFYSSTYHSEVIEDGLSLKIYIVKRHTGKIELYLFYEDRRTKGGYVTQSKYLSLEEYLIHSNNTKIKKFLLYYNFLVE